MIVIPPEQLTDDTLTSSNVPENDNPEWDAGTAYTVGQVVMVSTVEPNIHKNYEALAASTGVQPWLDDGTNWLDLGATNRWACFDKSTGSQTVNPTSVEVEYTPGKVVNGVSVLNVVGQTVRVQVDDPTEGIVYDRTIQLISDSGINDWYAYYFTPIDRQSDAVFLDLPAYGAATIRVIITEPGADAKVGVLAFGVQNELGITDYGTGIGIIDYSRKETDAFGNFIIQERAFSKRSDYAVTVNTNRVDDVQRFLTSIRAQPAVYIGKEDFGSTILYGYYRDFDIVLSSPPISECSIVVEGLT